MAEMCDTRCEKPEAPTCYNGLGGLFSPPQVKI